ncbi:hypothetical protein D915_003912 [Fasciola hepatica]|uniref:Uncharacterized protein n=1 Tax=Fasciola hepatica TaxID=6192 RepID=A0A4E0RFI8_FASHE|nr:hypothetical protein D915_003912 [Fasciola hepatica]
MSNVSVKWIPSSVTYVNSTWIQHFLWIALNVSTIPRLPDQGSILNGSISGCISLGHDHSSSETQALRDPMPSKIYVADMVVRIILIEASHFTHFTEQTKALEYEVGEWIDSYHRDARIYCTSSLRFSQDFHKLVNDIEQPAENDKPVIPYAREIQLVLGVVFCLVLAICLLLAFVLRVRSFVRRQMVHRRAHRTDRDQHARVHFAYDVGDTDMLTKPPVPSVTFGSNVYPLGQVNSSRTRSSNFPLASRIPSNLGQRAPYGWDRCHLNTHPRAPYSPVPRNLGDFEFSARHSPRMHNPLSSNGIITAQTHSTEIRTFNESRDQRLRNLPVNCTRFSIPKEQKRIQRRDSI